MSAQEDDPLEIEVQSALAEYFVRCDRGEMPDREEFLSKNPAMREKLAELLDAADWIEMLAGPQAGTDVPESANGTPSQSIPAGPDDETHPLIAAPKTALSDATAATLPVVTRTGSSNFSASVPSMQQDLSQPVLPCRFGDYVLEKILGRGGMGVVYSGHQVQLERPVAVKMIRSGALAGSDEVQRFYAEARSAAQLDHPNIVTVYQCGEHDGHHYFSMDYVRGTDLARMIQAGPLDGKRAARYVRDTARAIQYAHDRNILHRDIKPANVLVDENDQVRVTDFGLAKSLENESGLTATGAALGTPSYMPPEQAAGRTDEHSFRTDVYSLGAVLFALVTGKPPFQGSSVVQTLMQVMHRPAPLARQVNPTVHADIETIIAKCLHKTPERRYETAAALADDLDRFLKGDPIEARPLSTFRRAVYWSMGIPIIGALIGRRSIEPTDLHHWAQRGLIALFLVVALVMIWIWPKDMTPSQSLPNRIRFATGQEGGSYAMIGNVVSRKLTELTGVPSIVEMSEGAVDNRERLLDGRADLGFLQASTLNSNRLAVVAPLYYEAVHVLVRSSTGIQSVSELRGRRILLGPERSGSRSVAKRILMHHKVELAAIESDPSEWLKLESLENVDAAIVVVQVGNPRMNELLGRGLFRLLPIEDAVSFSLEEPSFHPLKFTKEHYPDADLEGVTTVATTAFLATRTDAPELLVRRTLSALYDPAVAEQCKLLNPEHAAHWQGIAWHPAAEVFFESYRTSQ
ncbi:MAG: serine/threonine-protein kinase [Pirellulales bacterium]